MNFPVFDLHCDTALALLGVERKGAASLRKNNLHIDLERAKTLPGYAQCFACYTSTWDHERPGGKTVEEVFEAERAMILREVQNNSDMIHLAGSASDVSDNLEQGIMSAILTIEGPAGFGFAPERLEDLYRDGFRISTLGWNEKNCLTGSHKTGGGLTDRGREYVKEAQRLGMIIDVSHISDEGFWDIMNVTNVPVIASHSNSRAVCGSSRNLTDDMFRAICQTGGVAGFNQFSYFVADEAAKADLDKVCDHILHFLEIDPEGKHIALGGDLDGCDMLPEGFAGVQDYPKMAQKLLDRGLTEQMVYDIFWNNALGVIKQCCT